MIIMGRSVRLEFVWSRRPMDVPNDILVVMHVRKVNLGRE
jgi:hypothetical protein